MRTVQEERDRISFEAKLVRLMLLAAWAWIIIGLSGQQGEDSAGLSLLVSRALADMLFSLKIAGPALLWLGLPCEPELLAHAMHFAVRKAAHVTEYAILGLLLLWWLKAQLSAARHVLLWTMVLGVLFAAADECHQLFVPGRAGQWRDVLIDFCGIFAAAALHAWLSLRRKRDEKMREYRK